MIVRRELPPIVRDMIDALSAAGDRNHKDNVASTLEAIADACSKAVARYRRDKR